MAYAMKSGFYELGMKEKNPIETLNLSFKEYYAIFGPKIIIIIKRGGTPPPPLEPYRNLLDPYWSLLFTKLLLVNLTKGFGLGGSVSPLPRQSQKRGEGNQQHTDK